MCGVAIEADGDRITEVRGDPDDPFSRGYICPKAMGLKDVHEDPDRLKTPLKRIGDRHEPISWEQAFDEIAQKVLELQARHGRKVVASYSGNPTVHSHGALLFGQLVFFKTLHTPNHFSATSLDQLPQMLAAYQLFGHQLLLPIPDLDRTDFFLIMGGNPVVSNGSIMTAPGMKRRLEELRARGGRLVVVDPRRTETAALADLHLPIRPGADAWLLLAMMQVVLQEGPRLGRLEPHLDGLAELRSLVAPITPERAAAPTGLEAAAIRGLALDFLRAKTSVAYGRIGLCTQPFGSLASWAVYALNLIAGRVDEPGGAMFTTPAVDLLDIAAKAGMRGSFARRKSRVRGLPEFGGEWPTAVLAEEIETPGQGQIRALFTSAGNPVLSAPDGRRLEKALATLELMVSIDIYKNETTRHAHYLLPPTFGVERDHYDLAFNALAVRNVAKYSPALWPRRPEQRHDWEIFLGLAERLEHTPLHRVKHAALRKLGTRGILDLGLRAGPHGGWTGQGLTLKKLEAAPHGVDLGPLEPRLPARLYTSNRRINLVPELYRAEVTRLLSQEGEVRAGLVLIGRRELRSNNSWMHNSPRLTKKVSCTLLMHPLDAAARGLKDRDQVQLRSRIGALVVPLEISEEMRPGVVSLPHGFGHDRPGIQLSVAQAQPGVSVNDLTDPLLLDGLSGTSAFSDVPVEVTSVAGRSPADRPQVERA